MFVISTFIQFACQNHFDLLLSNNQPFMSFTFFRERMGSLAAKCRINPHFRLLEHFFLIPISTTKQIMPYICIYIYIINTRPCPNEKTNLLNISFINVPTIAFFLIFSGATQKGRCSFEWRRCQRNGAYQSIKSDRRSGYSYRLHSRN